MDWLQTILYLFIGIVIGGVATFFITRYIFQKQIKENPPISEKQIRAMFMSMGVKPNEARVQQVLRSMGIAPSTSSNNTKKK